MNLREIKRVTAALSGHARWAVLICLMEEGPYRMKDLVQIFKSNNKEMSQVLKGLEHGYLVVSGMRGKTRWYAATMTSYMVMRGLIDAILLPWKSI